MKKNLLLLLLVHFAFLAGAQTIVKPTINSKTSFAIIIDNKSYDEAKDAVNAYRNVIEKDGLGAYIIHEDWKNPEDIRNLLIKLHADKKSPLEGVVFVGDIPVPMLRDAQHLTSAFKMDQRRKWELSSVPSDRYYDDFGLKFDFLKQDSINSSFFYYSLRADSKQVLSSDIYSARIKPLEKGKVDKYTQLRDYLEKVVNERTTNVNNVIDNLTMARGHGYHSQCKVAWSGEQLALREQFPKAFSAGNYVNFMDYDSYWPMKPYWLNEIQRKDLDVMLFHHHGSNDIQYVNGYKDASDPITSRENIKLYLRSKLQRATTRGKQTKEAAIKYYMDYLDVPRSWCEEAFDPKIIEQDSILNLTLDIYVSDILDVTPNARFVMLDACFNGSFYEDEYIAGAYIFNGGKTIAVQANTVNTIQDKWADEFVGLLSSGLRVGQWGKYTQYLETHIIGDPTFRFANNSGSKLDINEALTVYAHDVAFWKKQLADPSVDVQAIALRVLADNNYKDISRLLRDTYFESTSMIVRLEALQLLARYDKDEFVEVLSAAVSDSYELTRRLGAEYIGKNGSDKLIPALAKATLNDNSSKRVNFKIATASKMMNLDKLSAEINKQVEGVELYDRSLVDKALQAIENNKSGEQAALDSIMDSNAKPRARAMEISRYRNQPNVKAIDTLLEFGADASREKELRLASVEALGWYIYSVRRYDIVEALKVSEMKEKDADIKNEMLKTINRLK